MFTNEIIILRDIGMNYFLYFLYILYLDTCQFCKKKFLWN